jgi:hypothetical protein
VAGAGSRGTFEIMSCGAPYLTLAAFATRAAIATFVSLVVF